MKKPKPTQDLPQDYREIGTLDLKENRGLGMILNLIGIGLLFGVGWLLLQSLAILRPEYLSSENILVITGLREFWRAVLLLVVSVGLMVVMNEGVRGLMLWIVTRQRPKLGYRGSHTYAAAPEWFIPRNEYVLIRLAPLFIITMLGLVSVPLVSLNLVPGVMLLISLNIAAGTTDMVTAYWLLRKPKALLVLDQGDMISIFHPDLG